MSLRTISDRTILTSRAAREKYSSYYIGFARVEPNMTDPDNEKGYVVFVANTKRELQTMPRETDDGFRISIEPGYALGGVEIGGLYYNE